ncbi:hypothetical protein ACFLTQ_00430 [Chloroflexota bacterium]
MLKKFALVVIAGGLLVMLVYFIGAIFSDSDIPNGFRIGVAVVMAGSLILLIAVGWERYRAWKGEDDDFRGLKF